MIALGSLFENLKNIYFYYPGAAVLSRSPNAISTPSLFILHNPARLYVINYLRGGLAGYLTTSSGPSCGIKCQLGMKTWRTIGGGRLVQLTYYVHFWAQSSSCWSVTFQQLWPYCGSYTSGAPEHPPPPFAVAKAFSIYIACVTLFHEPGIPISR